MRKNVRRAFLFLLSGLLAAPFLAYAEPKPESARARPATADCNESPQVEVAGVLTRQYRGICKGGEIDWQDEHWEVGFVPLQVPLPLDLTAWEGLPVIVTGTAVPGGTEVLQEDSSGPPGTIQLAAERAPVPASREENCPQYQMRSDWVIGKAGFRVVRERSGRLPQGIAVHAVRPFPGPDIVVDEEELTITITNPHEESLPGLEVRVHYEGCYGKPGTTTEKRQLGTLQPGAHGTTSVPKLVSRTNGRGERRYVAYSIQLRAADTGHLFDFDLPLASLPVIGLGCPDRK